MEKCADWSCKSLDSCALTVTYWGLGTHFSGVMAGNCRNNYVFKSNEVKISTSAQGSLKEDAPHPDVG
jgi:hypothetical protein